MLILAPVAVAFAMVLNSHPAPMVEDSATVASMAGIARLALVESHPECVDPAWSFNRDASDGLSVYAISPACEYAAGFYRSPDTGLWSFAIEGA